ncbi:MAG: hypothetical protein ACTHK7_21050 [Aureliella sp.]
MADSLAAHRSDAPLQGRERPKMLRALGRSEPPRVVMINLEWYERDEIFKHDSWAATASYRSAKGQQIVCKFHRQAPVGIVPMRWIGRLLARREQYFLKTLAGICGIPRVFDHVIADGQTCDNAVAHEFIPGTPLSLAQNLPSDFFDNVETLLGQLHSRRIAYVDLHKQENVIVGDDGHPYLIDFQVSMQFRSRLAAPLFNALRDGDLFNADKHRWIHRQPPASMKSRPRPWWLSVHRSFAVPLRGLRRRLLVAIGVRRGKGCSSTEAAPEVGLRRAA